VNAEVKQRWIDYLVLYDGKKSRYQLRDHEGFSPGGLLCELAVADGIIDPPKDLTQKTGRDKPQFFGFTYDGEGVGIPEAVAKWADISYRAVWRIDYHSDCGKSFKEIADWIKEEF
jgi:hypothetical protein